ncbi:MAG: hypothetical protein WC569_04835 [Candidatus Omnitrophota bacterium]
MGLLKRGRDNIYVRSATEADIDEMMEIERKVWPKEMRATREMFLSRIATFPEGVLCAFKANKMMGFICSEIIYYKDTKKKNFDWYNLTDNGFIAESHNPKGDSLYGINLSALPQNNRMIPAKLIEGLGKLIIRRKLKRTVFGARMSKYHKYARDILPEKYIFTRTKKGSLLDPELSLYLTLGIYPVRLIRDYFEDKESLNYGVLVTWKNPFYKGTKLFPFLSGALSRLWRIKIYKTRELRKVGKKAVGIYIDEERDS